MKLARGCRVLTGEVSKLRVHTDKQLKLNQTKNITKNLCMEGTVVYFNIPSKWNSAQTHQTCNCLVDLLLIVTGIGSTTYQNLF